MYPSVVAAADLNNYYYAHANTPGNYVLKDKYNNTVLKGDYNQNDGHVMQISFRNWHASGSNKVVIDLPDGSQKTVTNGETVTFPTNPKQVVLTLVKTDYTESYVEISTLNVHDQSNGGVNLTYTFTGSPPTSYGDLGTGKPTSAPTATPNPTAAATPKPTVTPTPTPGITPVNIQARVDPTGKKLIWNTPPTNTDHIEVWRDGKQIATLSKAQLEIDLPENFSGVWEVRAVSTAGNIIGKTELILNGNVGGEPTPTPIATDPPDTGTDPGTEIPCSDACQTIKDQLECPEWDEYMGAWSDMIRNSLPPPPDWDMVADKIGSATIRHLENYLGSVPSPPSKGEIENETIASLPTLDKSVETDNLIPQVPSDYNNGKIDFDLNKDAPTIQVKDESDPFVIEDPLKDMQYDDPGVKVIPGDPRNSSEGIKQPDKVDTGNPAPTPGKIIFELPRPSAPPPTQEPPPMPAATTGPPPTPGQIIFELPRYSP